MKLEPDGSALALDRDYATACALDAEGATPWTPRARRPAPSSSARHEGESPTEAVDARRARWLRAGLAGLAVLLSLAGVVSMLALRIA
jgi:hypothetical protein